MLKGKFIATSGTLKRKKAGTSQINNPIIHLKLLEKQEQAKPKTSRQREIRKIRAKINDIETKKKYTKNQ
jgi:hypothetical protein